MDKPDTTETFAYMGRRLKSTGKISYLWMHIESDQSKWFPKAANRADATIGDLAEIPVEWKGGDSLTMWFGDVQFTGNKDERANSWRTEERADMVLVEASRARKRSDSDPELEVALNVVAARYRSLRGIDRKAGFLRWIDVSVRERAYRLG